MKQLLRRLVVFKLKLLAKAVLAKYRPRIIAVSGSVGKTTTKDLIAAMLDGQFRLRASRGGYNSEFGVPLTILDRPMPASLGEWFGLVGVTFELLTKRQPYPEVLVLEMSADKPGDLRYLTKLASPDIAVVTNVQPVHIQNYADLEGIAEEKSWLVRNLKSDGLAILNFDDTQVRMMRPMTAASATFYGLTDESNVWADEISLSPDGTAATIHVTESGTVKEWPVTTPLLGRHQLYAVLAAFAVAYATGVAPARALGAAAKFQSPAGRLRPLRGRGNMVILDDSYNSSPQAALNSLEVLKEFPKPHRAVLGEMRELGNSSPALHRMVGESLGWLDELVVVGPDAKPLAEAAEQAGAKAVHNVQKTPDAIPLTADWKSGTVLVKGSQNTLYLERVSQAMLRDPRDARLLNQRLKDPAHARKLAEHEQVAVERDGTLE